MQFLVRLHFSKITIIIGRGIWRKRKKNLYFLNYCMNFDRTQVKLFVSLQAVCRCLLGENTQQ